MSRIHSLTTAAALLSMLAAPAFAAAPRHPTAVQHRLTPVAANAAVAPATTSPAIATTAPAAKTGPMATTAPAPTGTVGNGAAKPSAGVTAQAPAAKPAVKVN